MYYEEENQFWKVRKFLYQALDAKRKVELLKRRMEIRDVTDPDYNDLQEELSEAVQEQKETEIKVTDFVSRLPDVNQQMVIVGRYVDGKSWDEISDDMVISVRGVQKLHGKALPLLKEFYDEEFPDEEDE